jgi:hypothetical protein
MLACNVCVGDSRYRPRVSPMAELLERFRRMPQTEARRAVPRAVQREKRLNRLAITLDRNQTKV